MKRNLTKLPPSTGLSGDMSGISGDLSGIRGNVSGIRGNVSGISGNLDNCELTDDDRANGVDINNLLHVDLN